MMRYEDAPHLPLPAAHEAPGIHNAEDIDSWSDDVVFIEKREPIEADRARIGREDLAGVRG